eukprot:Clim_evm33s229 gene=Clim_evmTU33s229
MTDLKDLITQLDLQPHPEGGYYRETYRAGEIISKSALPDRYNGDRTHCTAIYFFLPKGAVSHLHKIDSDELWHFYSGSPLTIVEMDPETGVKTTTLGPEVSAGQHFQYTVREGLWFGAIADAGDVLVGCTVAPGFDFAGFELGDRDFMRKHMANHADAEKFIERLTHPPKSQ